MRKLFFGVLAAILICGALPLRAQQPCPKLPVVINTPEDKLMLAVNGADNPQEQVAALEKFATDNPDSRFIPCVYEYLTTANLKLQDYGKAIAAGEKDLSLNYLDLNLIINMLKAYVAAGNPSENAFTLIDKAPAQIHDEIFVSSASTAEEAAKARKAEEDQSKELKSYMEYAFFQLLPRVPDAAKRLQYLDAFAKAYPDTPNVSQLNVQYFVASQMSNQPDKMFEYGQKAVEADPDNVATLNLVADGYVSTQSHLKEADEYAKKALDLATKMTKPENMSDEQFKNFQDMQLGLAHASIGFVSFQEGSARHHVAPAIGEFKTAVDLLGGNPTLQARTLFYLGYAYEVLYPPNHHAAAEALTRCAAMQSPWQGQAKDLLEKVKRAR